jgi:predicted metal-dependent phosphoesterase TrpH
MKIDFHVHTRSSMDSIIRPADLARKSAKLGIIPAIADHNSIASHSAMRSLKAQFIPAEEIFTDKGDLVGLYVNELIPKRTPFLEAIDMIHEQGGLAYLPHMFDFGRSGRHACDDEAAKADIIEVFNARCLDQKFNSLAADFAFSHRKPAAAGSDSHFLFEFGTTYVDMPEFDINSPKALMKALRSADKRLVTKPTKPYARGTTTVIATARRAWHRIRGC